MGPVFTLCQGRFLWQKIPHSEILASLSFQIRRVRDLAPLILGEAIDGRDSSISNLCEYSCG